MNELEEKLGIKNTDWLMSAREKLSLIGLLELLRPEKSHLSPVTFAGEPPGGSLSIRNQ